MALLGENVVDAIALIIGCIFKFTIVIYSINNIIVPNYSLIIVSDIIL